MTAPDPLAQAAMVAYCGWDPTVQVTETVFLDGNGTRLLTLPSLYVTAVTAVGLTDSYGNTVAPTFAATAYPPVGALPAVDVTWAQNGCLTWGGYSYFGWPEGQRNISVTYSGGYGFPPADLLAVLDSLTKRMPQMQSGRTSSRLGSAAFSYAPTVADGGLLLVEQMVLDRYRLPRVA